jgi:uncharacterized membrane protein HdeD (DUF308 family)
MENDPVLDPVQTLGAHWGWMLLYGVVLTALGVIMLIEPKNVTSVVVNLFGFAMLVAGVFDIISAVATDESGDRWARVLVGILSMLLGFILLRYTHVTINLLGLILGVFWLVRGLVMVVSGVTTKDLPGRGWRVIGGLVFTILGAYVLGYPSAGTALVIWIFGFLFLLAGLLEIAISFTVRSAEKHAA